MRYARLFVPYRGYWDIQVDLNSIEGGYHGEGRQVGNLIYASLVENTEDTRQKLQKLADLNKGLHLVLQLRRKGRVCFQTK